MSSGVVLCLHLGSVMFPSQGSSGQRSEWKKSRQWKPQALPFELPKRCVDICWVISDRGLDFSRSYSKLTQTLWFLGLCFSGCKSALHQQLLVEATGWMTSWLWMTCLFLSYFLPLYLSRCGLVAAYVKASITPQRLCGWASHGPSPRSL